MSYLPFDPDSIVASQNAAARFAPAPAPAPVAKVEAPRGTARPLDNVQKWRLSALAKDVYQALRAAGVIGPETLEGFRRRIAIAGCGKRISQAAHGDFCAIQAAFLEARGAVRAAAQQRAKAASTARDIAWHKLNELLSQTKTPLSYAATLAKRFYKGASLFDLNDKQLWRLHFTIRNNTNAAAGKGRAENRFKSRRAKRGAGIEK